MATRKVPAVGATAAALAVSKAASGTTPRPGKYGSKRVSIDGVSFMSMAEGRRYLGLKGLLKAGYIRDLELQPVYRIVVNGVLVCKVIPDFRYRDSRTNLVVVEDVKGGRGTITPVFRLKQKLLLAVHGVHVEVVQA